MSFPPANLYPVPRFLVEGSDKSTETALSVVPFLAILFLAFGSDTSGDAAGGARLLSEGVLELELEDEERDAVSPDKLRGNFMRGMKPDLGVVATGVLMVLSRVGVVGEAVETGAVSGLGSIAVGGGVGEVYRSRRGLGGVEDEGSECASAKSSSSSSSSSEERPPSSWNAGPVWCERMVPTPSV